MRYAVWLTCLVIIARAAPCLAQRADLPVRADDLDVLPGFQVERLYQTPASQGSWVSMTVDDKGRLIVSHEGGGLYRVSPSPLGKPHQRTVVEKLPVKIGGAHGLLYAFDSLYAVSGGLLRIRDSDGDDRLDAVEKLFTIDGGGEHGPHAVVLGPQKKWLYVIAGNATKLPHRFDKDRVAPWAGARNHSPPGSQGWVMRSDPEGKRTELFCVGMRNAYGLAVHPDGELFTFDSDNEGFMNLPWYRPTNVYHLVSGADFGWRQGPQTLQSFHLDNVPPILEVGPGSPTGMVFGTGARFPEKYRRALFVSDWSYGRIYAVHLEAAGASYRATQEFFLSGRPLAVTDLRIGQDGAMYFLTGGRGTQSTLYRVVWRGDEPRPPDANRPKPESELHRMTRRRLESYHGRRDKDAVARAWPHLSGDDRSVRYAARIAIEHQPLEAWRKRAMNETKSQALFEAMVALARQGEPSMRKAMTAKLAALDWSQLSKSQRLALLRIYELMRMRMGEPDATEAKAIIAQTDLRYPDDDEDVNRELIKLLVKRKARNLIERTIDVLRETPTAMRQVHFLLELNRLEEGWTEQQRERLLATLDIAAIRDIGTRNYRDVSSMIAKLLKDVGVDTSSKLPPRDLVKEWTMEELLALAKSAASRERDVQRGAAAYRKAQCHSCHRIGNSGGVLGPNLTGLGGRFKVRDALEAIVEPDKIISDQYRTTVFVKTDGTQFTGQIVNLSRGVIQVRLDPLRPFPRVGVPEKDIQEMRLSDVSLMPKGLLNYLNEEEIQDLLAYLLQRR